MSFCAERKLADMKENVDIVQAEIKTLQVSRVELLAQLEIVELSMAKAQAKQVHMLIRASEPN